MCINSQALRNFELISQLSTVFGSQSIVVSIDVKKNFWGKTRVCSYLGKTVPKVSILEYAQQVAEAGAGELFLTSIDREGSMSGFDLPLISAVSKAVDIPVIAHGGGGTLYHIQSAFDVGASAVSCGSSFIYQGPHKAVLINYLTEEEHQIINPVP